MEITYELTKQDYIEYNLFHLSYSKSTKKMLLIQRYLIAILFVILAFLFSIITDIPLPYWLVAFIAAAILWIIFFPSYIKWILSKRVSKMIDEGKNKGLLGKHSIVLSEDGITDIGESKETKSGWNTVEDFTEGENYYFIYISSIMAYIVPKRAFSDSKQEQEFSAYIKSKAAAV